MQISQIEFSHHAQTVKLSPAGLKGIAELRFGAESSSGCNPTDHPAGEEARVIGNLDERCPSTTALLETGWRRFCVVKGMAANHFEIAVNSR